MATSGQGQQQTTSAPAEKPFKTLRIIIGIIGTLLIITAVVLGILAATKTITDAWGSISSIVLGGLGVIVALFTWLWPFPADPADPSPSANVPAISPTIAPNISPTISPDISPTISPHISPTFLVTFATNSAPGITPVPGISTAQNVVTSAISNANTLARVGTSVAANTTPSPSTMPTAIFHYNTRPKQPAQFYGRAFERQKLINRMLNGGATAIAGERRIGKTWLLRYIQLIASANPALGPGFRVGYLSGSNPKCKTLTGFVAEALMELKVTTQTTLPLQFSMLAQAIRDLSVQNVVPVLCIDEFEGFDNKQEFGLDFAEGLRAMTQDDGLVLIIAGRKRLFEIVKDLTGTTSPFFNIVEQLTLKPFSLKDAEAFASDKATQASFGDEERAFLLEHATIYDTQGNKAWPPLHLQLTGQMMLDDREQAKDTNEPERYQIHEKTYQQDFKRRLDEQYQDVVKS